MPNFGDLLCPVHMSDIVDEKTLLKIKDINDELNSDLPGDDVNRNIFWKIKKSLKDG